jgi:membrane-associated phospholipid phosphatase
LALVVVSVALFAVLVALGAAVNTPVSEALDDLVETWFQSRRSPVRQAEIFEILSYIGSPLHVGFAAVLCGLMLSLAFKSLIPLALMVGSVGMGVAIEHVVKALVNRSSTTIAEMQGLSPLHYEHTFPSGHVTGTATFLGVAAVCLGHGRGRVLKALLAVVVAACVTLVAFMAVDQRGVHLFTDVIGGMVLGGAIVAFSAALYSAKGPRSTSTGKGPPIAEQ